MEQSEDQAADIELGGPELHEEVAVPSTSTSTPAEESSSTTAEAKPSTNGKATQDESNASGKRAAAASTAEPSARSNGADDKSLPPSKRTRVAPPGGAQRRLFGVLTKTLNKFQEETKKDSEAVSRLQSRTITSRKEDICSIRQLLTHVHPCRFLQSKRRAELEERLAAKRKEEQEAIDARTGHERTLRNLRFEIIKKEDEKNAFIAIYKARRASKLSLANFLCTKDGESSTSSGPSSSSNALGNLKPAPFSDLPHALPPSTTHSSSSNKPLYYLPYKLLPWQADKIDGQIEDMRLELDKEEDAWREELREREREIAELKARRAELTGASESSDRAGGSASRRRDSSRRDRHDDDQDMREGSGLADRAPLPERDAYDELGGDARAASTEPSREKEDSTMTPVDGDDRLECE